MPESASCGENPDFRVIETAWIALTDGTRLAARIWLPASAERAPVAAVLEYLPYRRRDGTSARDDITFPALARAGYAGVRVDLRGSGDSEGILTDEYTAQELNDGVEVIDWIARQSWCSGNVGMLGISWGGFNGLQIAALAPAPLKAVVSVCSTDDRYADDIHYKGGCLLNDNMAWSQQMLAYSSRPPDPAVVGQRWKEMWLERLEQMPLLAANWLRHQRRDAFWKHGSVGENPQSIKAAVLLVGGWADPYADAVFRLFESLSAPCHAIVGPWEHAYPHIAKNGPRIDFLGESVKWWDRWLKPADGGAADPAKLAPSKLTVFIEDAALPEVRYGARNGHWKTYRKPLTQIARAAVFHLNADGLSTLAGRHELLEISSPQDTGAAAGSFCPGMRVANELPDDQRADDAKSLVFETPKLTHDIVLLGAPVLTLELASNTRRALVAARLCEVAPDGAATLLSWGLLNLAHGNAAGEAASLEAGTYVTTQVELNHVGRKIPRGHRLRVAVSNAYWPMVWPSPEKSALTLVAASSALALPVLPADEAFERAEFPPPRVIAPAREWRRLPDHQRRAHRAEDGTVTAETLDDFGSSYNPTLDLEAGSSVAQRFAIHPDNPLSAHASAEWVQTLSRDDWMIRTETRGSMRADARHFHLQAELLAFEADELIFQRQWNESIARALV